MGIVVAVRDIAHEEVSIPKPHLRKSGTGRIPVETITRKREVVRRREEWSGLLGCPQEFPEGTVCGRQSRPGVLKWSWADLIAPLRAFYATYRPPMRLGAKTGPRGRKVT